MVGTEDIVSTLIPLFSGVAGITLIYAVIMTWLAILRNKREERIEKLITENNVMIRDLWYEWMKKKV